MKKPVSNRCEECGEKWFILIKSNGKLRCRVCISGAMDLDDGCAICCVKNTQRRWYKNRGSLCSRCLVAAMSIDEEAIKAKIISKQEEPLADNDHGIFHIGSDAWIENNENYQRVLEAWAKEIGRTQ